VVESWRPGVQHLVGLLSELESQKDILPRWPKPEATAGAVARG